MKITNLTPRVQSVRLKEITGDRTEYDIYIQPHSATEVSRVTIVGLEKLEGIIEVSDSINITPVITSKEVILDDTSEDLQSAGENINEEESKDAPVEEDNFICDICGAEFASARGLASHKSRAHADM